MLATGLPLLRVTLHSGTLHPQFLGTTFIWWRTRGQSEQTLIAHEITDVIHYKDNPVQRVCSGGETLRRRLDGAEATLDFAVLTELKAHGATDYLALPIRSIHGHNRNYMLTYVTDRPGGFTADEIADMTRVSQRVAVLCDIHGQRWIATNVLNAYLGPKTGPRVLAGQIRRGTGEELRVVLWSSDLRGFTERSDRLPGDRIDTGDVITMDADGYVQIVDRTKDVIKSGGEWISSIELEKIAVAHPAIREAAVVARPDARWGERPLLVVVLQPDSTFDRDAMAAHYTGKVAKWSIPDDLVIAPELPHTATGKLLKSRIRELYCAGRAATPP
jgi:acyl-CoA synthetase (AMP-forming)/AMP-acid ligase II